MNVEMIDRLAAVCAGVDHYPIALRQALFPGQICCDPQEVAQKGGMLLAGLGQRNQVLPGRNQEMHRRLGMNIGEGVTAVVLVFGIGWDASIHDLAEKAAHNRTSVQERLLGPMQPWQSL